MEYYGSSGDIRADMNGGLAITHNNYMGEAQLSGALITRAQRNAYATINSKLESSYPSQVPWASGSEPALLYEIANKLSMCFILTRKNPGSDPLDKNRRERYCEEPIKELDQIAEFEMQLPEISSPLGAKVSHNRDYTPVCDMDDLENQRVDPDLLDDIVDERTK